MNYGNTNSGGYTKSEMYTYVHNTVLPNLRKSGLNITACDLVSSNVLGNIASKTAMEYSGYFWLTDPYENYDQNSGGLTEGFMYVGSAGTIYGAISNLEYGVRPLITVVK